MLLLRSSLQESGLACVVFPDVEEELSELADRPVRIRGSILHLTGDYA